MSLRLPIARLFLALLVPIFGGCYGNVAYQSRLAPGGVQTAGINVQAGSNRGALASLLVITVLMADGTKRHYEMNDAGLVAYGSFPPPDPQRRIELQDCTQAADFTAGNLMCR